MRDRPRSARAVTSLIHRLQNPVPGREYEHKQRLLARCRTDGHIDRRVGAEVLGHRSAHTAGRLLGELVDEGLLARHAVMGTYVPAREEVATRSPRA